MNHKPENGSQPAAREPNENEPVQAVLRFESPATATTVIERYENAVNIGARPDRQQERSVRLGTNIGGAEFAATVSDRVKEKISQYPALAATAVEATARIEANSVDRSDVREPKVDTSVRDPILEKEPTATLAAARTIGISRERDNPSLENKARVEVIDNELNIRRGEGQPVQSVQAHLSAKDYDAGAKLLDRVKVEKSADRARVNVSEREIGRVRDEIER
jgi:hypothetical protein